MIRWIFLLSISFFVRNTQAGCGSCLKDSWCGCETVAPPCCSGYYWDGDIDGRDCWFSAYFKCRQCTCNKGKKRNGCNCYECGLGTYQPTDDSRATSCTQCVPGKYSRYGASGCTSCPAGYHQASNGGSSCGSCAAGQYSSGGASSCTGCSAGLYSSSIQASSCTSCPGGWRSDGGARSCTRCAAGKKESSNSCEDCLNGWVSSAGATSCTECAAGKYDSSNSCKNCDAGYGTTAGASSKAGCGSCPKGKSSVSGGPCTDCSAGKYQDQTTQSTCKLCATGKYLTTEGNDAASDCISCGAGKANPNTGSTSASACVNCVVGKYASSLGMAECKDCEKGRAQSSSGENDCDNCQPGQYQDQKGQTSCKDCVAGKWCDSTAATHVNSCKSCQVGYFSTTVAAVSSSTCTPCVSGKFSDVVAADTDTCTFCPVGKYQPNTGNDQCIECAPRKVTGVPTGALSCNIECLNGYEAKGQTFCTKCPTGSKLDYNNGDTECTACDDEIPYSDGTTCYRCLPGNYLRRCTPCPAGRYTGWNTIAPDECTMCETGYQDEEGQSTCKDCPSGRVSSGDRTTCVFCPRGEYSDADNLVDCKTCVSGKQYTGIIGEKDDRCNANANNIYGEDGYTSGGVSFELIELSGENDGSAKNLQRCTGECDGDWQCAAGLKCFQRENAESIPGCKGNGAGNTWDYCYDPNTGGAGANFGYQAKLSDVIDNSYTALSTTCTDHEYQNTFDGSCKSCPVGLFKGADPPLKIVGPNDFNVCKFCPAGRTAADSTRICTDCPIVESNYNNKVLDDFPHQDCRYDACPMGSFARSGVCVPCPAGTYWEYQDVAGIPYENSILHSCDQMETQFHASLTAAQRTSKKEQCELCYANPSTTLIDMGPSYCSSTTHWKGNYVASTDLLIYGAENPGNTLEEERDACETECRKFNSENPINAVNYDHAAGYFVSGFIIWVQEGSNRGKCFCAVNTDLSRCTTNRVASSKYRTYSFGSPGCQAGKDLRASTTTYVGLCRSCPPGQYQDFAGQNSCKYCPSASDTGSVTCP